jgi:hypothetical protein
MSKCYELSDEAEAVLSRIAMECGITTPEVLSEAIGLLDIAWEAKVAGQKLVVVGSAQGLRLAGSDSPYRRPPEEQVMYEIELSFEPRP